MARSRHCFAFAGSALVALSLLTSRSFAVVAPDSSVRFALAGARALANARRWTPLDSAATVALTLAEQRRPADSVAIARALVFRGLSRYKRGLFGDSLGVTFLNRSLDVESRLARPDTAAWIEALGTLGSTLTEQDAPDSALVYLARGRTLCLRRGPAADSVRSELWMSSGWALRRAEHYDAAIAAYDTARAIRTRLWGEENAGVAESMMEIGGILGLENRLEEATGLLERSIVIYEHTLGPASTAITTPMSELASVQQHAGEVARSIETLERSVAILAHAYGESSARLIPPRFNIGLRLFDFGDYAAASAIFADLLVRAETSFGVGNSRTEYIRSYACKAAFETGDTAAVARHIARTREALAGRPLDTNHTANDVESDASRLWLLRGDPREALLAATDGLRRELAASEPSREVIQRLLQAQLSAQIAGGDAAGQVATLRQMAERFGDAATTSRSFHSAYLHFRARAERDRGQLDSAWTFALRSEAYDREQLHRDVRALPDRRALQLASRESEPLDILVALSDRGGEPAIATAWDRVVRWRGLVTAELERRRPPRAEAAADSALLGAHARWVRAERHAAQLEVAEAADGPGGALALARNASENAEREYATLAAARDLAPDTADADLARVRASLAPGEALVSIVTIAAASDSARMIAFATRGSAGALVRVDLGRAATMSQDVARWRVALASPPQRGREVAQERACRALGERVRARTLARLAPRLAGATRWVVVADGALADLPWQALPLGSRAYLVEGATAIDAAGAERELLAARRYAGRGLLALGDPDFGFAGVPPPPETSELLRRASGDCAGSGALSLDSLPGARAEVEGIAKVWDASHPADPATVLVGAAGSEREFKLAAPGRELIHIATHGIVWDNRCVPLVEGLRGVGGVGDLVPMGSAPGASTARHPTTVSAAPSAPKTALNPWSGERVWLALSGANRARSGAGDENEGLLTADEVVTLDLSGVDWVVLSACQSGAGQQWPLDGSAGMRRAFRLAGTRTVFASQWSIADQATREWMNALYSARLKGVSSGDAALRMASRSTLASRRQRGLSTHPFYWAAFSATGR